MRKCHAEIVNAWVVGAPKLGRLENGVRVYETDGTTIWYRGNAVVRRRASALGWVFTASNAGWTSPTTRAIINAAAYVAIGKHVVGQVDYEQIWYGETVPEWHDGHQTWHIFGAITGFDYNAFHHYYASLGERLTPRLVCNDGFSMSVQASHHHYCTPKADRGPYARVEIGAISETEPLLEPFRESDGAPNFGWVPLDVLHFIIRKHGGVNRSEKA